MNDGGMHAIFDRQLRDRRVLLECGQRDFGLEIRRVILSSSTHNL